MVEEDALSTVSGALSTWSGSYFGIFKRIPQEVWDFLTRTEGKAPSANPAIIEQLKSYQEEFYPPEDYSNGNEFHNRILALIHKYRAYNNNKCSKRLWLKYLTVTNDFSLLCVYCNKSYINYRGFQLHLPRNHAEIIEALFIDTLMLNHLLRAFQKINVKTTYINAKQETIEGIWKSYKRANNIECDGLPSFNNNSSFTSNEAPSSVHTSNSMISNSVVDTTPSESIASGSFTSSNSELLINFALPSDDSNVPNFSPLTLQDSIKGKFLSNCEYEVVTDPMNVTPLTPPAEDPLGPVISTPTSTLNTPQIDFLEESSINPYGEEEGKVPLTETIISIDEVTAEDEAMIDAVVNSPVSQQTMLIEDFDRHVFSSDDNNVVLPNLRYTHKETDPLIEVGLEEDKAPTNMTESSGIRNSASTVKSVGKQPKSKYLKTPASKGVEKHKQEQNSNHNDVGKMQVEGKEENDIAKSGKRPLKVGSKRKSQEVTSALVKRPRRRIASSSSSNSSNDSDSNSDNCISDGGEGNSDCDNFSDSDEEVTRKEKEQQELEKQQELAARKRQKEDAKKRVRAKPKTLQHKQPQERRKLQRQKSVQQNSRDKEIPRKTKGRKRKSSEENNEEDLETSRPEANISIPDGTDRCVQKVTKPKAKRTNDRASKPVTTSKTSRKKKAITEEESTFLTYHLLENLQKDATKRDVYINEIHRILHEEVLKCVSESVKSTINKRQLKSLFVTACKKYINEFGKARNRSNNRASLGNIVKARIYSEYYSKKTGKTSNPYRAKHMLTQLENFKTYINNLKIAESKSKIEKHLKEMCKDHDVMLKWKEKLKPLSKVTSEPEYQKHMSEIEKACGNINEVKPIINLLRSSKLGFRIVKEDREDENDERDEKNNKKENILMYEVCYKNNCEVKPLKNLVSQLIKGSSVSNLKHLLKDKGAQYIKWHDTFNKVKQSLNVSNNMKWFLNHVAQAMKDIKNPLSPLFKFSKQEVKKQVQIFIEYILTKKGEDVELNNLFTEGFYYNLTIFAMKYLYFIYDKILLFFKLNPLRSQIPNEFHMGLIDIFMKNENYGDEYNPPSPLNTTYNAYISKHNKNKVNFSSFMSTERVANCMFHMRLISKGFDLKTLDDLIPYFQNEDLKVIDLIESKCNMTVYDNLRGCLFVFLYNLVYNVLYDRNFVNGENIITNKQITWDFFKTCLFNPKYYEYGSIAFSVINSFPTLHLKDDGEPIDSHTTGIVDDRNLPWFEVSKTHMRELFRELFPEISSPDAHDDPNNYLPERNFNESSSTNEDTVEMFSNN